MKQQFLEFIDRRQREAKKHLKLLGLVLKKNGFQVESHLSDEDPYIWLKSTEKNDFEGVRIYEIGSTIAFRVQKEEKTEPYGNAYVLDVEDMFNDYMGDNISEEMAGRKVIEAIGSEFRSFFKKSAEAEKEIRDSGYEDKGVILKTGGTDYSNMVLNKM
jgi:hypothetical protein